MSDEPSDDYFAAAAAVVEAARAVDAAEAERAAAWQALTAAGGKKTRAEGELRQALEQLKRADTGRQEPG